MTKISLIKDDITTLEVDAIVNAANQTLLGGGGVDGAIHFAAGPELVEECEKLGGCKTGEAKITRGYNLPAKHVIHTVGPVYKMDENPEQLLKNAYRNSLEVARENNLKSIAFPCLSTGIFGYPKEDAAKVATETVKKYIEEFSDAFDEIIFCVFDDNNLEIYNKLV